jgi:hypothetical protein
MGGVRMNDAPFTPDPDKGRLIDRVRHQMGLDEDVAHEDVVRAAEEAAERLHRFREDIPVTKVAMAGVSLLLLIGLLLSGWYWMLPRDGLTVHTVYMQKGGHVLLVEVENDGSRAVADVEVLVRFLDAAGEELDVMDTRVATVGAHSAVAGDDLEMQVVGATVWANYTVSVSLTWTDYAGDRHTERWEHDVGEWATEVFNDRTDRRTWPF